MTDRPDIFPDRKALTNEVVREKLRSAESYSALVRLAIIIINAVAYTFLMDRDGTIPSLAWPIMAVSLVYGFYVAIWEPFNSYPLKRTSYLTSLADAVVIVLWIIATGMASSPFFLLWYISIIAIAQRFTFVATVVTSIIYAVTYIVIVRSDIGYITSADMFLRVLYIPIVGVLAAFFSREFETQVEDKLRAKRSEFKALSAKRKQKELLKELQSIRDGLEQTVQLRTADLLKAKLHAETLARTKQEFLANLSHEIRTPMNAIVGIVQLLADSELTTEQREYLSSIDFASDNLLNIINDVLDISKLESGQVVYESIPFQVKDVVNRTAEILRHKADGKGLELEITHGSDVPSTVTGDPTRLNQILVNLIGNAIKFTDSGHVKVCTRLVSKKANGVELEFAVQDTGIGIALEDQDKIFESFQQAKSDTTRKFGGTGLGLTIIKQLAEDMDGRVELTSTVGQGSEFTVTLPFSVNELTEAATAGHDSPSADLARLNGIRGLIAEDNDLNRMVATRFLQTAGIVVESAESGAEAVRMAAAQPYDFILMDIQMPEMDGYEATRQIRKSGNTVPIIAMTAHAFSGEREKCIASGMNSYLTKPMKREVLHLRIAELIPS